MNWEKWRPIEFEYKGNWIYNWFSNMITVDIEIDGILYKSVENYYQSEKFNDPSIKKKIIECDSYSSKKLAQSLEPREDWNDIKIDVMRKGLYAKFEKKEWKDKLLSIKEPIIEWNNWGDKYWGVTIDDNKGKNMLGLLLTEIRNDLNKVSLF